MRFSCEEAPGLLGHADATVRHCGQVPGVSRAWSVLLDADGQLVSAFVFTDPQGQVTQERGPAFAGQLLADSELLERPDPAPRLNDLAFLLEAAGGRPAGFPAAEAGAEIQGFDRSRLEFEPFRMVLLRTLRPPAGPAGIAPPRVERATLRPGTPWTWTIHANEAGAGWVEETTWPLK